MCKKIKIIISAAVMAAAMAGANPVPAATNNFITAEAAAKPKPSLSKKTTTLAVGQTLQLKMRNVRKPVKWYSSNKKVASVSGKGMVKAKKNGTASITAKIGKKKYRCKVKVKTLKIKNLKIIGKSSIEAGNSERFSVSISPANASNQKLKWTSSNTKVASVSSTGVVTAKKEGSAVITAAAADGSKKSTKRKITIVKKKHSQAENYPTHTAVINLYNTENVRKLASKADECVLHTFEYFGFKVEKSNSGEYSGYFTVKERRIYLRDFSSTTIYHELGHFLAWISGSRDKTAEFRNIYEKEKQLMISPNKPYNTKDSSEYFAESYKEYCLDPAALKKQRPLTYGSIVTAVNRLDNMSEAYLSSIKQAYEKTYWN